MIERGNPKVFRIFTRVSVILYRFYQVSRGGKNFLRQKIFDNISSFIGILSSFYKLYIYILYRIYLRISLRDERFVEQFSDDRTGRGVRNAMSRTITRGVGCGSAGRRDARRPRRTRRS